MFVDIRPPVLPEDATSEHRAAFYLRLPKLLEKYYEAVALACKVELLRVAKPEEQIEKIPSSLSQKNKRRREKKKQRKGNLFLETETPKNEADDVSRTDHKERNDASNPAKDKKLYLKEKKLELESGWLKLAEKKLETYAEVAKRTNKTQINYSVDEHGRRSAKKVVVTSKLEEEQSRKVEISAPVKANDEVKKSWIDKFVSGKKHVTCLNCSETDILECGICFNDHYEDNGIQTPHAHKCKWFTMKISDGMFVKGGAGLTMQPRLEGI